MQIAGLLLIAGCGATPSLSAAPTKPLGHPCDPAHWSELAQSPQRVWPANASAPAHLVEVAGADVEVASVTFAMIATRWVPYASLSRVAITPTAVSPAREAATDPAVRILVGHRLDPPSAGWAAVHDPEGFVPARVAGTTWTAGDEKPETTIAIGPAPEESVGPVVRDATSGTLVQRVMKPTDPAIPRRAAKDRAYFRYASGDLRTHADDTAPLRFSITPPTLIQIVGGAPNGYLAITVFLPYAELDGFWKPPPPEPPSDRAEIDYTRVTHSPIAPGTCLYDAPKGRVVGMIRDADAFASPTPSTIAGWYEANLPTIWGPSTYYIDTPPIEPPADLPADEWPNWPANEW